MMGKRVQRSAKLFHVGFNLEERVPPDHALRRIEAAVDFTFVRPMVAEAYGHNGHESLDPVVALKLLFLCHYENVRSERETDAPASAASGLAVVLRAGPSTIQCPITAFCPRPANAGASRGSSSIL